MMQLCAEADSAGRRLGILAYLDTRLRDGHAGFVRQRGAVHALGRTATGG